MPQAEMRGMGLVQAGWPSGAMGGDGLAGAGGGQERGTDEFTIASRPAREFGGAPGAGRVGVGVEAFRIRVASDRGTRSSVSSLIRRRYEWRGYGVSEPRQDAMTFAAEHPSTGAVMGTISARVDGPMDLLCDERFSDVVEPMRASGLRLCEFGALATEDGASKLVLCSLFHVAYLFVTRAYAVERMLVEVNPRHEIAYRRALGFKRFAAARVCDRVGAPAVLLGLDAREAARRIREHGGAGVSSAAAGSLYAHFFSPAEEAGIANRLLSADVARPD